MVMNAGNGQRGGVSPRRETAWASVALVVSLLRSLIEPARLEPVRAPVDPNP